MANDFQNQKNLLGELLSTVNIFDKMSVFFCSSMDYIYI